MLRSSIIPLQRRPSIGRITDVGVEKCVAILPCATHGRRDLYRLRMRRQRRLVALIRARTILRAIKLDSTRMKPDAMLLLHCGGPTGTPWGGMPLAPRQRAKDDLNNDGRGAQRRILP